MVFRNRLLPVLIAALLTLYAAAPGAFAASRHHGEAQGGATVTIGAGDHKGLSRVLVSWRQPVGFVIDEAPGVITVTFDHPAKADLGTTPKQQLRNVQSIAVVDDPQKLVLRLAVKAGAKSRAFKTGNIVIVDVLDPAPGGANRGEGAPAPVTAAATQTTAEKTESKSAVADETIIHLQPAQSASLAVFRRGKYLWLATDGKAGLPTVAGPNASLLVQPTTYSATTGTLFRYTMKPLPPAPAPGDTDPGELQVTTRQHGGGWDVVLAPHQAPLMGLNVVAAAAQNNITITAPGAAQVVSFIDPDLGDTLSIVPLPTAGEFIAKTRRFATSDLLQTAQGVAAIAHGEHVTVSAALGQVTIAGMELSTDSGGHATAPALFDFAAWYRGGPDKLLSNRRDIEHAVIKDEDSNQRGQAIELARLFLANGYGNEALGALKLAQSMDPNMAESPDFIALRGGAEALQGRVEDARKDLSIDALQNQPEAILWRALAESVGTADQKQEALSILHSNTKAIEKYPPELKRRFALALAALAVERNEAGAMEPALTLLTKGDQPDNSAAPAIATLKAGIVIGKGKFADSDKLYASVPTMQDQYWTALAGLASIETGLAQGSLKPKDAIPRLESLRYCWRGDEYEYRVLAKLGDLYFTTGDYKAGLDTFLGLISAAEGTPYADAAHARIIETAKADMAVDTAAKSSPLDTYELYNTFLPSLPAGAIPDSDVRALSDRLAAIGVTDQAVALIEPQMNSAADPALKARLGERIAALRLLDDKPDLALKVLADSNSDKLDAKQKSDRKLLQARAQFKSGKPDDAVATLQGETSREADALRVEIAWPQHDWKDAAAAFGRLAGSPAADGTITDEQSSMVLNEAVALNLGKDLVSLEQLRKTFAAPMAKSKNASAFALLTSPNSDVGAPSLDAVRASVSSLNIFENFLSSYRKEPGKA